jgi:hypothetical protein
MEAVLNNGEERSYVATKNISKELTTTALSYNTVFFVLQLVKHSEC